ncbi:MAG TPA: hypothetical protein VNO69_04075 [Methyloceanibacter sp.]|nr:hypothetical protein [Methyloceanibacter sp.]
MREKRAWLTRDREAESKETEAFEASVTIAKDTIARSGEMLVSANEDLTDHQRWLEKQFAAVQADRARHERWLERQQEYREAATRRDEARRRRQLARQRAMRAVARTVAAAGSYLRSHFWRFVGTIVGLLTAIGSRLWDFMRFAVRCVLMALSWVGGLFLVGFAWGAAKARVLARAIGDALAAGLALVSARLAVLLRLTKNALSDALSWSKVKAQAMAPALYARIATAGGLAAAQTTRIFDRAKAPLPEDLAAAGMGAYGVASPARAENALSLWTRARGTNLSQMLIIAGALLLVCGGLMLGGGLILRAGTLAESNVADPIAWGFEAADRPLTHRVVFTLSGTPQAFRINGLLIHGENTSDRPLNAVEGVIKPDVARPELKLVLDAGVPVPQAESTSVTNVEVTASIPGDTIPAQAPFNLVFAFPGNGLSAEEFFGSYGGLTLNVRYEADGKQRAVIQYLSPEMLKAQLAEVQAMGS